MYQIREANQMVEEFMLAANVEVAEKILKHFPLCALLRFAAIVTWKQIRLYSLLLLPRMSLTGV